MDTNIIILITIGYVLGITICGVLAYLGSKGTNEIIEFHNQKEDIWKNNKK